MTQNTIIAVLLLLMAPTYSFAQGFDSLNVSLLYHWSDSTIPPAQIHNNNYNEVWGYASNGREYAIIGTTLGTHFFDVTNPTSASQVAFVQGAVSSTIVIHRDMKVYADHLFIVSDEGPSTMQVVDLQYLPDSVVTVYNSSSLFNRAHNIFIDTSYARLYTCGGNNDFAVYDISVPNNPVLEMNCEAVLPWWGASVGYVHDAYVRNNIAYLNAATALYVVDFSDLQNVSIIGSLEQYPEQGYNHSGWLNDAGTYYAMCDETHGTRIKGLDVTDLTDIQVKTVFGSEQDTALSIVHNVVYRGDQLHAAFYHDGYWLWDTNDPINPVLLGYYDTSEEIHALNYRGAWGVYPLLPSGIVLVSDMQEGLFIFDISAALSVDDGRTIDEVDMRVWPNPASAELNFRIPGLSNGSVQMVMYDSKGSLVYTDEIRSVSPVRNTIPLNDLGSDLYHLQIRRGVKSWNSSFVIE
jgi:choice-of-anchor B domain-containing protein